MYDITRDSEIENIEYFRTYAMPALKRLKEEKKQQYVAVKTHASLETDELKESYSVLIKKEVFDKAKPEDLAKACQFYVDYSPSSMYVSDLEYSNSQGGRIRYTRFEKIDGEWRANTEIITVLSEEQVQKLKDEEKSNKKVRKELSN